MSAKQPIARRTTRQQVAVAEQLRDQTDFVSAQELHAALKTAGESVGLATVYRILQNMASEGEVDVLRAPDGEAIYRRCSTGHHHHLVCRSCGRAVEVEGPQVERWAAAVSTEHGFTDVEHTVEIFGTCADCTAKG
ncbi:Fur family transcriptional regulator [Flexivirga caeni]|uniref:Transcriptional repressor n=1 Tax=Flexivirga caeni TaxID=2294115 RepID=A0A3M9M4H2_9MICO|nr:Fur family transcriptional regulator [Flexivirga caeni]RNI20464.1 transcriptional repressor [Flexivirga caeni]